MSQTQHMQGKQRIEMYRALNSLPPVNDKNPLAILLNSVPTKSTREAGNFLVEEWLNEQRRPVIPHYEQTYFLGRLLDGREVITTAGEVEFDDVPEQVQATSWIDAKEKFGLALTPLQERIQATKEELFNV